jgi:uncharacterized protein (TIGR03435 family)
MRDQLHRRRLVIATAGFAAVVVAGALTASRLRAQAAQSGSPAADRPSFEIASIKPNKSEAGPTFGTMQPGGRWTATNVSPRLLITWAYLLSPAQSRLISAAPGWIDSEHLDIEAKATVSSPTKEQTAMMIQSLLADRFKLLVHFETRQLPVYALVLSKLGKTGPQLLRHSDSTKCLDPSTGPLLPTGDALPVFCGAFLGRTISGTTHIVANNTTVVKLAVNLSAHVDRVVVDRTGLSGAFDLTLDYTEPPSAGASVPDTSGPPSLSTALQEQLGLKLVPQTGPVDVLVIDQIEEPSPN